jgi:outer membrane immunogenic protein
MKKLLVASIAAAALYSAPALAADIPVKAPMAAPFNWTGFYFGGEAGGGWGREHWLDNSGGVSPRENFHPDGGIFGGQAGYRWMAGPMVLGIEGTGAWADLKGTSNNTPITETLKVRALYTGTAQVGFAQGPWLAYVKGGWAGASTNLFFSNPGFPITATNKQDPHGGVIGGGVDYAASPNWIFGVEYDHFDLGLRNFTAPVSNGGVPLITTNVSRLTIEQVVARLSYKY